MKRDGTKRKHSNMVDKLNTTSNYINSNILNTLKLQQQQQKDPHLATLKLRGLYLCYKYGGFKKIT